MIWVIGVLLCLWTLTFRIKLFKIDRRSVTIEFWESPHQRRALSGDREARLDIRQSTL